MLARTAKLTIAIAALLSLAGCATRYDAQGNLIYRWQFGQDIQRDVDYSNPRLPILPRWRPNMELWPVPSPWEFNDLSRYSMLDGRAPLSIAPFAVGDNADCAACNESTARLALLAVRADARGASPTL
jgi:outer membrane receptor protein involved in Fe transport